MASAPIMTSQNSRCRLTSGVLSWLAAHISSFDPPQEDELLDTVPEGIMPGPGRKAFGELGLALRLCDRTPALRGHPDVRMLTERWLRYARDRRIFFDARRRIHLFPLLAVALAVLGDLGEDDGDARLALQTVLDRGFVDRTERSAWGQVDIAYYLDAAGLRHDLPDLRTAFRRSSLLRPPVVAHALRLDLYASTHLLFHLTDFGAARIPGASAGEVRAMADYMELAMTTCLAERDWDLVGECLAARACLRVPPAAIDDHAMTALADAQQRSGFVPDLSWLRRTDAEKAAVDEFAAVYHPTLVALIMIACDAGNRHREQSA